MKYLFNTPLKEKNTYIYVEKKNILTMVFIKFQSPNFLLDWIKEKDRTNKVKEPEDSLG